MLLEKYGNSNRYHIEGRSEGVPTNYILKDCGILFANFSGRATRYNPEGNRNFNVRIDDPAIAQELANYGFNVRLLNKLDEDAPDSWALKMILHYRKTVNNEVDPKDPKIKEAFEDRTAELTRHNVSSLDDMKIKKAIVEFRPFYYDEQAGKCTAYVNRAKFWVIDDWYTEGDDFVDTDAPLQNDEDDIPF